MDRISLEHDHVAAAALTSPYLHGLRSTVGELRTFFEDDHLHMALVVDERKLVATVVREDLDSPLPDTTPAWIVGSLKGRTVGADALLAETLDSMQELGQRRLAVIDEQGRLIGLLCLKESGRGFCSDADVESREVGP